VSGTDLLDELPDPRAGGAQAFEKGESGLAEDELARYRAALEMLPPQQKRCLILRVRDELPYGEIARTLHLSVHTVRNHLQAARKSLRDLLQVDFEEGEEP
jgi:RNA polymerase sigma factor (sigma-70 family)